ncbi:hypothetical protein [Polaromonas sp.]|uniref:hypothetical protein n=1 Tax=Polaromonas sp. TaxID=1869339 RepID=UPI00183E0C66|nr:hypothetical protein [Polaromonas sp.]NMM07415.1 hypothetical protein [Polaromonas sp.]
MNDNLTAWGFRATFTSQEAALAIVGEPPSIDAAALVKAAPALEQLQRAYEGTRKWLIEAPVDDDAPAGMLVSEEMANARRLVLTDDLAAVAGSDFRFQSWLRSPAADFERQHFSPETIARWLQETGLPSEYGFRAPGSDAPEPRQADTQPQAATMMAASASDGVKHAQAKRQTWREVAWPYMEEVFKTGQYKTAKEFYRALESKAGTADSPFDRGTGQHRASLFIREISATLTMKTVQNYAWNMLKASRK